jgi:hypothetical protein
MQKEMQAFGTSAPAAVEGFIHVFYGEVPAVELHGLPARAPSIASKIGAIVEMPMSSRP